MKSLINPGSGGDPQGLHAHPQVQMTSVSGLYRVLNSSVRFRSPPEEKNRVTVTSKPTWADWEMHSSSESRTVSGWVTLRRGPFSARMSHTSVLQNLVLTWPPASQVSMNTPYCVSFVKRRSMVPKLTVASRPSG